MMIQNYHKHTSLSHRYNKDSPLVYMDYFKELAKYANEGIPTIYSTVEHGWQGNYFKIYSDLEKFNKKNKEANPKYEPIKFVFGTEAYWVKDRLEKDNANNHIVLLAKNDNGRKKINRAIYESFNSGYYYKNRMDLDILLSLPKSDVMVTSACIGFYGYEKENNYTDFTETDEIILKLSEHFDDFYLEVQYHNTEAQKKINQHILELSRKYNIPIICGLDSHVITLGQMEDREDLLRSNKISYEDEEGWYMDFPCVSEVVERFRTQGILSDDEIYTSIENTSICLKFDDIILDKSLKVPVAKKYKHLTQEERNELLKNIVIDEWNKQYDDINEDLLDEYCKELKNNLKEITDCGMADYFIDTYEIVKLAQEKYGGVITDSGRGSCCTENTLILTKSGYKTIKDVKIGDEVISDDCKFHKVINTISFDKKDTFYKIKYERQGTIYNKYGLEFTSDHKFLVNRDGILDYIEAQDLNIGDLLCCPKIQLSESIGEEVIDLNDYNIFGYDYDDNYIYEPSRQIHKSFKYSPNWFVSHGYPISRVSLEKIINGKSVKRTNVQEIIDIVLNVTGFKTFENYKKYYKKMYNKLTAPKKIKRYLKKDKLYYCVVGMMYGDGWTSKETGIALAVNSNTKTINRQLFYKFAYKVGLCDEDIYVNVSKTKNLQQIYVNSKILNYYWQQNFFTSKKGVDKQFNSNLFDLKKDLLKMILYGLKITDGSVDTEDNRLNYDSTSMSLIGAYAILDNAINQTMPININLRESHVDKRNPNWHNKESFKARRGIRKTTRYKIQEDKNYWFLPILSIDTEYKTERVYDLTVTERHSYVANSIIVHNCVSYLLNRFLGFTKVDKVNADVTMYAERFMTAQKILESKTLPDIDHNVNDRQPFIQAQKDIIGEQGTFDLIAFGTLKYKSAFKMYARACGLDPELSNEVTKQISKYEEALKHADENETVDIYDYVDEKYKELIEGCQKYRGIIDNFKPHPCSTSCTDFDAIEEIGVIMVKSESNKSDKGTFVAIIESGTIDEFGLLKQDYLIVDTVGLTSDLYKETKVKHMSINKLLQEIDGDKATWDIYSKGYTMCINQVEQENTTEKAMRYKPQNIVELTMFIAGIRPSFQTMYKTFESRQHFDYGIKAFDDLLQDKFRNSSFILYQEDLMKVLGFAGFPMAETYTIIKAISKKKTYVINSAKEKFIPNFAQAILDTKETDDIEVAKETADKVWQIIENSAQYGFNCSHAYCMAIDSVTLAWFKAHYPLEFYKVCMQRYADKGEKDKVTKLKKEMLKLGITVNPIQFGHDNRTFSIDKEHNCINSDMTSIKNIQKVASQYLYEIGLKKYDDLFYIFKELRNSELNTRTIEILFRLNYFREYGDINYIEYQWKIYNDLYDIIEKLATCKQLSKATCEGYFLDIKEVSKVCGKETAKMFKEIDNEALINLFMENIDRLKEQIGVKYEYVPATILDTIFYEVKYSGYTDKTDDTVNSDTYIVLKYRKNNYGSNFVTLYRIFDGVTHEYKVAKKIYTEEPIDTGDMIKGFIKTQYKKYKQDNKWVKSDQTEDLLSEYVIIKKNIEEKNKK